MRKIYSKYVKKQNPLQAALRVGQPLEEDLGHRCEPEA